MLYWLDILGTAAFAISGVLLASKLRIDPFGVLGAQRGSRGRWRYNSRYNAGKRTGILDSDPGDLVVAIITCFVILPSIGQACQPPK